MLRIILTVWIILWGNFILRDLFKKKLFYDYKTLLSRDAAGRRSYAWGDYFFEFLEFSKMNLPQNSTYSLMGVKDFSIEYRRAVYFLYPLLENDKPEYVLVFNEQDFRQNGYALFKKMDDSRFILRKI